MKSILVKALIWDKWNTEHIKKHKVSKQDVVHACKNIIEVKQSYRKRLLLIGTDLKGSRLKVVLSPEDRHLKAYETGTYYVITAFRKD